MKESRSRVDRWLDRASEWLNPILVKEARQALKSQQFMVTFTLLLVCGWAWSLVGVALLSQAAYYAPGGRFMLTGYFLILGVPLIVIVPFSAFRSLAAEREDGTFELLAVTTLSSRQIISGKLGSAVLQMIIYYSGLAPCIAFTYLLRGIDVLTIGMLLLYSFLFSLILSQFALMVATLTRSAHWQILLSVVLVLFLAFCDLVASFAVTQLIYSPGSLEFDQVLFWVLHAALGSFYFSTLYLFLCAAAAQISFASDNRSTRLRWAMLIQHFLWIGWMTFTWAEVEEAEVLYAVTPVAAVYWFLAGSLLTGEMPQLSPRVKRTLPQSFFGRSFLTWLNPGSGTGYMFAVINISSLAMMTGIAAMVAEVYGDLGAGRGGRLALGSAMCAAYTAIFVGLGRLVILFLRRYVTTGLVLPLLINGLLAILGVFVPLVAAGWLQGFSTFEYNELQASNWAWTIERVFDSPSFLPPAVPLLVFFSAGVMVLLNLIGAFREVEQVRLVTPQRVLEDDWELHPERAPRTETSSDPWDGTEVRA